MPTEKGSAGAPFAATGGGDEEEGSEGEEVEEEMKRRRGESEPHFWSLTSDRGDRIGGGAGEGRGRDEEN